MNKKHISTILIFLGLLASCNVNIGTSSKAGSSTADSSATSASSTEITSDESTLSMPSEESGPIIQKDAVITFSIENGAIVYDDNLPTVTVSSGADYEVYYGSDDTKIDKTDKPFVNGNTWAIIVEVHENAYFKATKVWRWFYFRSAEVSSSTPTGEKRELWTDDFNAPTRKWGNDGNNGVRADYITVKDHVIDFKINETTRTGSAYESKEFFGPGSFEMVSKADGISGICFAMWTFYYADNGNVNDEIDIEYYGNSQSNDHVIYSSYVSEVKGTHVNEKLPYSINDGLYHSYRFDWHRGNDPRVEYYIDGDLVSTIRTNVPTHNMKLWVGAWCPSWAGENVPGEYHMYVNKITYQPF